MLPIELIGNDNKNNITKHNTVIDNNIKVVVGSLFVIKI
jgi:hypothetical protein